MISLSDAISLESSNPAVNAFKPWWEVAVDYTFNAFLLVVIFAMAGVTLSGTPGLRCLPKNNNLTSFNSATNYYLNAKCVTHVDGHILIVFPYILFSQWTLLFVLHLSWFNLPDLKAFLAAAFDTFTVLDEVREKRPKTKTTQVKRNILDEEDESAFVVQDSTSEDDEDLSSEKGRNARLVYLIDSLHYLLQFKYGLVYFYVAKSLAIVAMTFTIAIGITYWLGSFKWKAAFLCDLHGSVPPPYDVSECSFAAAPYVYSMMVLNVIFVVLLCIFNLCALVWHTKFRFQYTRYKNRWNKKGGHPLQDSPGFYDYFFCIMLLKSNTSEGKATFKTLELAFGAFGNKSPEETEAASELALIVPDKPIYSKDWFISTKVLGELGMEHKISSNHNCDLWVALVNGCDEDSQALPSKQITSAVKKVREKVLNMLLQKQVLFKNLINKDAHCSVFEKYIEEIKDEVPRVNGIKEDHYVLMAYAIAYQLNVVVLRAQKSSLLYEPEHSEEVIQSVRFLTFVPPYYYYASTFCPDVTTEQKDLRLKFLTDQEFQTTLLKKCSDLWESEGYQEYKRTLENIFPQELPYHADAEFETISMTEVGISEGLRQRLGRSKKVSEKLETIELVETV